MIPSLPRLEPIVRSIRLVVERHPRDTLARVLVRWRPGKPSLSLTPVEDWQQELVSMVEADPGVLEDARAAFAFLPGDRDPDGLDASPALAVASYVVAVAVAPERVVETGVGRGFTTHMILSALDANGKGQ